MANKSIKQYTQKSTVSSDDAFLLQLGTSNEYRHIEHIDMMMGVQRVVLTLTQAQIQALNTTPISLVVAQGAGTVIEPLACAVFLDHNGTNYATANNVRIKHSGQSNLMMSSSTGFIDATADRYEKMVVATTDATNQRMFANTALVIDADADATANGGTITVDLLYIVKTFA